MKHVRISVSLTITGPILTRSSSAGVCCQKSGGLKSGAKFHSGNRYIVSGQTSRSRFFSA